jgi:hypothetical protein
MKTKIFLFIVLLISLLNCYSDSKSFQGEIIGIKSDGKSIFALMNYSNYEKLQIIHPIMKATSPLPKYKSFYRYFEIVNNKIIVLFDNNIFIYDSNLNLIKRLKLPDEGTEYHFNYSLNQQKQSIIIMGGNGKCYLLKNLELKELRNEIVANGNKIELKNNIVLINKNKTEIGLKIDNSREIKYKNISSLIHFLFILDGTHLLFRNSLVDNNGKVLAALPFTFEISQAILYKNNYVLFSTENILIINKDGNIVRLIKESESGMLGYVNQDQVVLEITQQYLGFLSLKTFELKKIDLGEKISSAVLLNDTLFYIPEINRRTLKAISIKEFNKD